MYWWLGNVVLPLISASALCYVLYLAVPLVKAYYLASKAEFEAAEEEEEIEEKAA